MSGEARSPEELETLFEDAFVVGHPEAFVGLFEEGALLADGDAVEERGGEAIARLLGGMRERGITYVADPTRVLQARDTALVIGSRGINVVRRSAEGWRYAISLLDLTSPSEEETMSNDTSLDLIPVAVKRAEGEARWWFAALAVIRATAADTGGQMTIIEVTEPPGAEAPLHVHHREDEGFWILDGSVTLHVGGETIEAEAGDYAFGPRDIPHRYTVGPDGCRMLFICTPGGFEDLVREMSVPAQSRTLPPPSDESPDLEHVARVAAAHGAELLV